MDDTTFAKDGGAGREPVANRLFDLGETTAGSRPAVSGSPRLRYANRQQAEIRVCALDALIPEEHPVRLDGAGALADGRPEDASARVKDPIQSEKLTGGGATAATVRGNDR